jgi:hypothetical protein
VATGLKSIYVFLIQECEKSFSHIKFCTQVGRCIPTFRISYPRIKSRTQTWNFILEYNILYLRKKLYTQVKNYVPGT